MKAMQAPSGAFAFDSVQFSRGGTFDQAKALRARGFACFIGYLGSVSVARLEAVLAADLAFMPVTYAAEYKDGAADEIAQLRALGITQGVTVWLDLEGTEAFHSDPIKLAALINKWAFDIRSAGWMPGLYVGSPQPFTEDELYALQVSRYWRGQGAIRDRFNKPAEPFHDYGHCRGWNMYQAAPSVTMDGILLDVDMITGDYKGETPVWTVA